jgi:phage terminase large subunit
VTAETPNSLVVVQPDGTREVLYTPTDRQLALHTATAPNVLFGGAVAGGKSIGLRWDAYIRCLAIPGFRALFVRRTTNELRSHTDQVPFEAKKLGLEGPNIGWMKGDLTLRFTNGSTIRFGHCEDDESLAKHLSFEYDALYMDEAVTFTELQFRFLGSRLRSPATSAFSKAGLRPFTRLASNPSPGKGGQWVKRLFISKDITPEEDEGYRPDDYILVRAGLDDNPYINKAEYEQRLRSLPTEALRQAYRHGNWDAVEGQFFSQFSERVHVTDAIPDELFAGKCGVVRSIDFGWKDPTVVLWIALLDNGRRLVFKERFYTHTIATDIVADIKKESTGLRVIDTVCDPSMAMTSAATGTSIFDIFEANGLGLTKADNDRKQGWQIVQEMLSDHLADGQPRLMIHKDCQKLIAAIPCLVASKNDSRDVAPSPVDHAPDALRYALLTGHQPVMAFAPRRELPFWMRKPVTRRVFAR